MIVNGGLVSDLIRPTSSSLSGAGYLCQGGVALTLDVPRPTIPTNYPCFSTNSTNKRQAASRMPCPSWNGIHTPSHLAQHTTLHSKLQKSFAVSHQSQPAGCQIQSHALECSHHVVIFTLHKWDAASNRDAIKQVEFGRHSIIHSCGLSSLISTSIRSQTRIFRLSEQPVNSNSRAFEVCRLLTKGDCIIHSYA